jgi:hypothetical protein
MAFPPIPRTAEESSFFDHRFELMRGKKAPDHRLIRRRHIISSGYSPGIVHAGLSTKSGIAFLPKPYETTIPAKVIRECRKF